MNKHYDLFLAALFLFLGLVMGIVFDRIFILFCHARPPL